MSKMLKTLALMALAVVVTLGISNDAEAGPCKRDQVRTPKGKCVSVPTTLERAPRPEPAITADPPETPVAVPITPQTVPAVTTATLAEPRPPGFMVGVSTPTLIRVPGLPPLITVACGKVQVMNGTIGHVFLSETTVMQSFGSNR